MPIRYVLAALKPGVRRDEYERWEREVCYPEIKGTWKTIVSYRTHRITEPIQGIPGGPWDYIERIEITDRDAYLKELRSVTNKAIMDGYERYIDRPRNVVIWSELVEP